MYVDILKLTVPGGVNIVGFADNTAPVAFAKYLKDT